MIFYFKFLLKKKIFCMFCFCFLWFILKAWKSLQIINYKWFLNIKPRLNKWLAFNKCYKIFNSLHIACNSLCLRKKELLIPDKIDTSNDISICQICLGKYEMLSKVVKYTVSSLTVIKHHFPNMLKQ
jgi:hypothetical protein